MVLEEKQTDIISSAIKQGAGGSRPLISSGARPKLQTTT